MTAEGRLARAADADALIARLEPAGFRRERDAPARDL
jgi:hypothetical protein